MGTFKGFPEQNQYRLLEGNLERVTIECAKHFAIIQKGRSLDSAELKLLETMLAAAIHDSADGVIREELELVHQLAQRRLKARKNAELEQKIKNLGSAAREYCEKANRSEPQTTDRKARFWGKKKGDFFSWLG